MHDSKGPMTINLDADGHNAKGRNLFRIHGDTSSNKKDASEGCIILPPAIRKKITTSNCKTLIVVR